MACKTEKRVIGGREFTATQKSPLEALPLQTELALLLPALAPSFLAARSGDDAKIAEALVSATGVLRSSISPERLASMIIELVVSDHVSISPDGKSIRRVDIDLDFAGERMPQLYQAFAFVLEVNFADFFGASGLGGLLTKARGTVEEKPPPPA